MATPASPVRVADPAEVLGGSETPQAKLKTVASIDAASTCKKRKLSDISTSFPGYEVAPGLSTEPGDSIFGCNKCFYVMPDRFMSATSKNNCKGQCKAKLGSDSCSARMSHYKGLTRRWAPSKEPKLKPWWEDKKEEGQKVWYREHWTVDALMMPCKRLKLDLESGTEVRCGDERRARIHWQPYQ